MNNDLRRGRVLLALFAWLIVAIAVVGASANEARFWSHVVTSPNGRIRIEMQANQTAGGPSVPTYRVSLGERPVVLPSRLGIELTDGSRLGDDSVVEKVASRHFQESYEQFPGKRRRVHDHGLEAVFFLVEQRPPRRRWEIVTRVYDDGAAFRFPGGTGFTKRTPPSRWT